MINSLSQQLMTIGVILSAIGATTICYLWSTVMCDIDVATLRVSRLQDAINVIIPYQDYVQADRAIIQSILNRWKP